MTSSVTLSSCNKYFQLPTNWGGSEIMDKETKVSQVCHKWKIGIDFESELFSWPQTFVVCCFGYSIVGDSVMINVEPANRLTWGAVNNLFNHCNSPSFPYQTVRSYFAIVTIRSVRGMSVKYSFDILGYFLRPISSSSFRFNEPFLTTKNPIFPHRSPLPFQHNHECAFKAILQQFLTRQWRG